MGFEDIGIDFIEDPFAYLDLAIELVTYSISKNENLSAHHRLIASKLLDMKSERGTFPSSLYKEHSSWMYEDAGCADVHRGEVYLNVKRIYDVYDEPCDSFLTHLINTTNHELLHCILEREGISKHDYVVASSDEMKKEIENSFNGKMPNLQHYIIKNLDFEEFFTWEPTIGHDFSILDLEKEVELKYFFIPKYDEG